MEHFNNPIMQLEKNDLSLQHWKQLQNVWIGSGSTCIPYSGLKCFTQAVWHVGNVIFIVVWQNNCYKM